MNLTSILEIVQALFTLIGVLKVLAHYTPWKWDDRVMKLLDFPARLFKK